MPLLCISLFALLLLPLSQPCSSRPLAQLRDHFSAVVRTDLNKTTSNIATLLQNSSCSALKYRPPSCATTENLDVGNTLHILTCKMRKLRLPHKDRLVTSLLHSIGCPCKQKPTKEPRVRSRGTAAPLRRTERRQSERETKKLCKAKAILSSMTECYEMLHDLLAGT
ncbi:uncharacterized protein ACBR49_016845 [Aulostomus maculatus]